MRKISMHQFGGAEHAAVFLFGFDRSVKQCRFNQSGRLGGDEAERHGEIVHPAGGCAPLLRRLAVKREGVDDRNAALGQSGMQLLAQTRLEFEGEGQNDVHQWFAVVGQHLENRDFATENDDEIQALFFDGTGDFLQ